MAYRTPLEAAVAKKTTKAIVDYEMIEDGDRVMVGLSGGKDSWALLQILDVLRRRAPIRFSLVAINVNSGYERFRHEGRMDGANLHLVHSKLSELLAFRRTVALARAMHAAVYFVHTSAKEGVDTIGEARADGLPVYGETLH